MLTYAALGAFALWMRLKYGASFLRGIEELVNEIADDFRLRILFQIMIFVTFGAIISVILVEPNTGKQALAAGMAWTALLGALATAGTTKGKRSDHPTQK
jgi:hypothetical protein